MRNVSTLFRFILSIRFFLFIAAATILCSFSRCKKDDEPQLPPETTTGAMTFGCKINGKVFVPKSGNGRSGLNCQYVYLGNGPGGGWFLNIPAIDWRSSMPIRSIHIETDSLLLNEGATYYFNNLKGYPLAFYTANDTYFAQENSSTLFIKKHDLTNRILSGTFSFIGTNGIGEQINITEGRFDIRY